jgi:hypothetical protein
MGEPQAHDKGADHQSNQKSMKSSRLFDVAHPQIAERNRAMIGLQHERPFAHLGVLPAIAGRREQLLVVVYHLAIQHCLGDLRVGDFLAGLVEARGQEDDVERLPPATR